MNAAVITALCAGLTGIITAIAALVHSINTRQQIPPK